MQAKRRRIEQLRKRIARLNAQLYTPDPVAQHFVRGQVGPDAASPRLNRQRERALDRTIDTAVEVGRLRSELEYLEAVVRAEELRPVRERAMQTHVERIREELGNAGPGCRVMVGLLGEATVVRINAKSVTVRTASGYRQSVPFDQIACVIDEGGAA